MLNFDNTLQVKKQAKNLQHFLNVNKGNEKILYNKGDIVKSSQLSPYNVTGKIIDIYMQNGYVKYIVQENKEIFTLRQKDIEKVVELCK